MIRNSLLTVSKRLCSTQPPQLINHSSTSELKKDPSKPCTLILGFGGAKQKQIQKYANVYDKLGYPSISYTGQNWTDGVPCPNRGSVFEPIFTNELHRERPFIIHCVSMNGFLSLCKLYRFAIHRNLNISKKIKGIVFDSCPCHLTLSNRAYGMAVTIPPFSHTASKLPYLPYSIRKTIESSILLKINPAQLANCVMYFYMKDRINLPRNQLYIYSKDDAVIGAEWVEKFALTQAMKKKDVSVHSYESSPHVQHLLKDPKGYENEVKQFLKRCLK